MRWPTEEKKIMYDSLIILLIGLRQSCFLFFFSVLERGISHSCLTYRYNSGCEYIDAFFFVASLFHAPLLWYFRHTKLSLWQSIIHNMENPNMHAHFARMYLKLLGQAHSARNRLKAHKTLCVCSTKFDISIRWFFFSCRSKTQNQIFRSFHFDKAANILEYRKRHVPNVGETR